MSTTGGERRSETFSELHSKKNNSEKVVTHIFTRWCDKVTYKMFEESTDSKSFQRKLLDIAKWRDDDITYSYRKFRKWLKKEGEKIFSERELEKVFAEYIVTSMKCMCDNEMIVKMVLTERSLPTIDDIYYKCIRRIARHLYDNPKLFKDKSFDDVYNDLFKITKTLLIKFIPFKRLLEEMEMHKRENEEKLHSYNFDKLGNTEDGEDHHRHTIQSKNSSTTQNTLRYFSSDEFEHDYYNPDKDEDIGGDFSFADGEQGREDNMLKQIDMRINYATKQKKINNNFM